MKPTVHKYADGGKVVKDHLGRPMAPPEKAGKPKRIVTKSVPGGPHTPGAKSTYPSNLFLPPKPQA